MNKKYFSTVRLLVVGASAAHLVFLRNWCKNPILGVEVIFINETSRVYYTGTLSKLLNLSLVKDEDTSVDLFAFSQKAGIRFIEDQVQTIDPATQTLFLQRYPAVCYDYLFFSPGVVPSIPDSLQQLTHLQSVYPSSDFVRFYRQLWERWEQSSSFSAVGILGSGIVAAEIALNLAAALERKIQLIQQHNPKTTQLIQQHNPQKTQLVRFAIVLFCKKNEFLKNIPSALRNKIIALLEKKSVRFEEEPIKASQDQTLFFDNQPPMDCMAMIVAQKFAPCSAEFPFQTDERGFFLVDPYLRALNWENVFISGTANRIIDQQTEPNSGVKSVRQGKNLIKNFPRVLTNKPLKPCPLVLFPLSIINTGEKKMILQKGSLFFVSRLASKIKERIDTAYLHSFSSQRANMGENAIYYQNNPQISKETAVIFCAGCGAKVGGADLTDSLQALQQSRAAANQPNQKMCYEDASTFELSQVQGLTTLDFFSAYLNDPYLMGQVIVHHALNDLIAKNSKPVFVNALVVVERSKKKYAASYLQETLLGMDLAVKSYQAELVAGHSALGAEFSVGIQVCGEMGKPMWAKNQAQAQDVLFLTKPLGFGVLVRGIMTGKTRAESFAALCDSQLKNHYLLLQALAGVSVSWATDISGFGFLGHLAEVLAANQLDATIDLSAINFLPQAEELHGQGVKSSLWQENVDYSQKNVALFCEQNSVLKPVQRSLADKAVFSPLVDGSGISLSEQIRLSMLFDPCTAGPIMFGCPPAEQQKLQAVLQQCGFEFLPVGFLSAQKKDKPQVSVLLAGKASQ